MSLSASVTSIFAFYIRLSDDTRTPAQRRALIALLRSLKTDYPDAEIMGHCELEGVHKDCPSFSCQEYRDYFDKLAN